MDESMVKAANNTRYERKFLVEQIGRCEAEHSIRLHRGMFYEIYHPRQVNNIYFESTDWGCYQSSMNGDRDRRKVRIRWYGAMRGEAIQPVLEIKVKKGQVGYKETYPLSNFKVDEQLKETEIRNRIQEADIPDVLRAQISELHPILFNSYQREYYQSSLADLRLTLDWDMMCCRFGRGGNRFAMIEQNRDRMVIELKYHSDHAHEVCNRCGDIPFTMTKSSKYSTAVETLFRLG